MCGDVSGQWFFFSPSVDPVMICIQISEAASLVFRFVGAFKFYTFRICASMSNLRDGWMHRPNMCGEFQGPFHGDKHMGLVRWCLNMIEYVWIYGSGEGVVFVGESNACPWIMSTFRDTTMFAWCVCVLLQSCWLESKIDDGTTPSDYNLL